MGNQIIKQPNGKYCLWTTYSSDFVLIDVTPEEIMDYEIEVSSKEIKAHIGRIIKSLEQSEKPYYQFTKSFEEVVKITKNLYSNNIKSLKLLKKKGLLKR